MKQQEELSGEMRQDRRMRQRAQEWLLDHSLWHFARVTEEIDPALRKDGIAVWFALADAQPPQTTGLLLSEREEWWEILAYKTVPKMKHSSETIQDRFALLVADLKPQGKPIWRSDQEGSV